MPAFLSTYWVHLVLVGVCAGVGAVVTASGVPDASLINAALTAVAGGVGIHGGAANAK